MSHPSPPAAPPSGPAYGGPTGPTPVHVGQHPYAPRPASPYGPPPRLPSSRPPQPGPARRRLGAGWWGTGVLTSVVVLGTSVGLALRDAPDAGKDPRKEATAGQAPADPGTPAEPDAPPPPPDRSAEHLAQGFDPVTVIEGDATPYLHRFDVTRWDDWEDGVYTSPSSAAVMVVEVVDTADHPGAVGDAAELDALARAHAQEIAVREQLAGPSSATPVQASPEGGLQIAVTYLPGGTRAAIEAHTVLAASNGQVVAVTVVLLDESGRDDFAQMLVSAQDVRL